MSGIEPADLAKAADIIAGAESVAYYAWNGVGQSVTATQTDRAISILYALTGSYGRKGGNVPGGAASFVDISGPDLLSSTQRGKALGLAERPLGPGLQGWVTARDVYKAVLTKAPYPVRMLMSFGTNLLVSQPDTETARKALSALEFHVHADFFINATARYADIILPVATSWEREGLRTGFDGSLEGLRHVQLRPPVVAPVGEARSDTDIVMGLAAGLGLGDRMFDLDADRGHDTALARTGLTVEMLRASPAGITVEGAAQLDAQSIAQDGRPRGYPTPTGKIEIYSERLMLSGYRPVPELDVSELDARRSGVPVAPRQCQERRLLPQPASQHRLAAPADARSDRRDVTGRCSLPYDRSG